jgi:phage tail sheath protein FI
MPEYLSPGVYIEEIPARLKAIEGVSTSTGGFVGPAERGPVPGLALPFTTSGGVGEPVDPAPVLVTSFADFGRQFGKPLPAPDWGFLAYAVKAFFDNGGKRCYVARIVPTDATRSQLTVNQGVVLRLARPAKSTDTTIYLTSLRGVGAGGTNTITFHQQSDGSAIGAPHGISSYTTSNGSLQLPAAVGNALDPNDVYAILSAVTGTDTGPRFWARHPGQWSKTLTIAIANADRGPVPVTAPAGAADDTLTVKTVGSFYRGAIVEIDHGTATTRSYHEVIDILPGNQLKLASAVGTAVATTGFARVVEIDVTILDASGPSPILETFKSLTWNPRNDPDVGRRYYANVINARSRLVYVQPPGIAGLAGSESASLDKQPTTARGFPVSPAQANWGTDGAAAPGDTEYVGVDNGPGQRTGIQSLKDIDDIRIIAAPGQTSATVQNELITQCETLRYRFAVLDGESDPAGGSVNAIVTHRNSYDTSFAAYYVPWVTIADGDQLLYLPPSGHLAGVYARTDNDRGVWKAPANEVVRGIIDLKTRLTTGEQDILNPRGINALRVFEGRGIRVWGARTLSSDPEFRYVNVRRFLIFLEASLDRGTQWVVFEPNAPETWSRVTDSISAFLHTQWRSGALFGRRPEDAFFVRCDETTMSVDDIQNGRLICQIGVAIVRPAEFVIFRIEQITGFAKQG